MSEYVVIGAGIIGLYTSYLLVDRGVDASKITILAEFLPGDQSIYYASPYAGAGFAACVDEVNLKYSRYTYEHIEKLQAALGGKGSGIGSYPATEYLDEIPEDAYLDKIKAFVKDFEIVQVPPHVEDAVLGIRFKAWAFNSPLLIKNLLDYLVKAGVTVKRGKLQHISEAFAPNTKVVFNCSGTGSISLGGVADPKAFPARGQVVVIRAPHVTETFAHYGKDQTYVIKRPDSNTDELILGGIYQLHNFDPNVYGFETEDILTRTTQLVPDILDKNPLGNSISDLQILRVIAGARPYREGGVRIEREKFAKNQTIIHNYGAGGQGYLCGLGMSSEAVDLYTGDNSYDFDITLTKGTAWKRPGTAHTA